MKQSFVFIISVLGLLLICINSHAQIYKYKDANGNWVFTDSPVTATENMETMEGVVETKKADKNINPSFQDTYRPKNEVEKASFATMTIHTHAGSGSGFFITSNGYIITNKHVLRGDEQEIQRYEQGFSNAAEQISALEERIGMETAQLERTKTYLEEYAAYLETLRNSALKKSEAANYNRVLKDYEQRKARFQKNRQIFKEKKQLYEQQKSDFNYRTNMARTANSFKITLKNGTTHDAYLVSESENYDLALLKLDRHTTPFLLPLYLDGVHQGMPVYAIGSPIGLKDSVSSGIVSGIERGYIKTNAQIYPGNSGGPLVGEKGNVIGINTMKKLTRNFEGLGFAIPISVALQEFRAFIQP